MATDLSLLKSGVTDVLELTGKAAEDAANANAQAATASGNTIEAGAYGSAVAGANEAARLEAVAGSIRDIQENRKIGQTLASQRAAVSANGFAGDSGSSLAIAQSSLQQGYLTTQLNDVQTQIDRGGFLEQAAASTGEQQAAEAAAASATKLGAAYTDAGSIATANAASETAAITALLKQDYTLNGPLTPQQQATQDVITSTLNSPLNGAAALPASAVPAPNYAGATGTLSNTPRFTPGLVAGTMVPSSVPAGAPTPSTSSVGLPANMGFMTVAAAGYPGGAFVPTLTGRG